MMKKFLVGALMLAAAGSALGAVHVYPGAAGSATVVGSVGYINPNEVGYFWSQARGDSVTETFVDPLPFVVQTRLDLIVVQNFLSGGNVVNWTVLLNGLPIGNFTINEGFTGPVTHTFNHLPVPSLGGTYTVRMEVANQVPVGGGSHTFYAGLHPAGGSTVTLIIPSPASLALLGLSGLVAVRRRR